MEVMYAESEVLEALLESDQYRPRSDFPYRPRKWRNGKSETTCGDGL